MTVFVFTNNANSTLAAPIGATDTTCTLAPGTGALFPNPGAGQQFTLSFRDAATATTHEIVYCTARSGDTCTIIRGQEGTTQNAFTTGDYANHFITAATAASFATLAAVFNGGPTSSRPASPSLYQSYQDTTLGFTVWCSQITPSIVWVNAAGVSV